MFGSVHPSPARHRAELVAIAVRRDGRADENRRQLDAPAVAGGRELGKPKICKGRRLQDPMPVAAVGAKRDMLSWRDDRCPRMRGGDRRAPDRGRGSVSPSRSSAGRFVGSGRNCAWVAVARRTRKTALPDRGRMGRGASRGSGQREPLSPQSSALSHESSWRRPRRDPGLPLPRTKLTASLTSSEALRSASPLLPAGCGGRAVADRIRAVAILVGEPVAVVVGPVEQILVHAAVAIECRTRNWSPAYCRRSRRRSRLSTRGKRSARCRFDTPSSPRRIADHEHASRVAGRSALLGGTAGGGVVLHRAPARLPIRRSPAWRRSCGRPCRDSEPPPRRVVRISMNSLRGSPAANRSRPGELVERNATMPVAVAASRAAGASPLRRWSVYRLNARAPTAGCHDRAGSCGMSSGNANASGPIGASSGVSATPVAALRRLRPCAARREPAPGAAVGDRVGPERTEAQSPST